MQNFDIKKMLSSPVTGLYWVKCVALGCGIFVLLFLGYAVYRVFVPAAKTTQTAQTIDNHTYEIKPTFGGCVTVKAIK